MSSTADADDVIEVTADGVTVRKRFAADEFPVPAIRFEIESNHDEPVTFRLSEEIPESFPMDKVGFHPEYYSEDWTAFQDNHVEFTGTLEADESLVTVYGIRIDDESAAAEFLTEPTVVEVSSEDDAGSDADAIDDDVIGTIVDDDGNQAVKDMIAGEADSVPGLEDEDLDLDLEDDADVELGFEEDELPDAEADEAGEAAAADDPVDLEIPDEEVSDDAEKVEESEEGDEPEADPDEIDLGIESESDDAAEDIARDDGTETADEAADTESEDVDLDLDLEDEGETADDESDMEDADEPAIEEPPADAEDDGESATPAESETDDDDIDVTADDAGDETTTESDETGAVEPAVAPEGSIGARLAAEIRDGTVDEDDLEVLRAELDLGPSGSEIAKIEHLQSRVDEVTAYTDAIERFLDEEGTGEQLIEEFRAELSSFEDDLTAMDETLEATDERVGDVETDVESLTDWTADLETDLETVSGDVETLDDDLEAVTDDVGAVDERVDDLADELEEVQEGLTDIQDWRDQLGSMFADD